MAAHGVGLMDGETEDGRSRNMLWLLGVLVFGLVACGAVVLGMNYRHNAPVNGAPPINSWGMEHIRYAYQDAQKFGEGDLHPPTTYNQKAHIAFGAGAAAGLEWACLNVPKWPVHPIGLVIMDTWYANHAFASILLGWLIKVLVLRYGGSHAFRRTQPVFLGFIMGEVFAAIFWGLVSVCLAGMGVPYERIEIQPS
jgi:hypothetical protein